MTTREFVTTVVRPDVEQQNRMHSRFMQDVIEDGTLADLLPDRSEYLEFYEPGTGPERGPDFRTPNVDVYVVPRDELPPHMYDGFDEPFADPVFNMNLESMLERGPHPGTLLPHHFDEDERSAAEIARQLRVSEERIEQVLAGEAPIDAELAMRIGRLLDMPPALWLKLQHRHDLAIAMRDHGDDVRLIPRGPH